MMRDGKTGRLFRTAVVMLAGVFWCGRTPCVAQGPATLEDLLHVDQARESTPPVAPEEKRLPVPTAADVAAARDLIRQAYEEDYAQATKAPRRLIDKLTQTADQVEDVTRRYALLVEAEDAAIKVGDLSSAIGVALKRSQYFEVDPTECRLGVLVAAAHQEQRDDLALFQMLIDLADEASGAGQLSVAEKAVTEASAAVKRIERSDRIAAAEERKRTGRIGPNVGKAPALLQEVTARQRQLKERRKAVVEYEQAVETLRQSPDDSRAHGIVGRYRCFLADDWSDGLRSLLLGDSEALRTVAGQELKVLDEKEPKAEQLLAVAGAWWKVAEAGGIAAAEADAIKRHAAKIYQQALPEVTDPIERALVSKRVAAMKMEVDSRIAEPSPNGRQGVVRRGGAPLRIPASALLPAPADLSPELVPLLPTEAEIAALQNHVNVPDDVVSRAKHAFLQRVYQGFGVERWSTMDALYVIELSDRTNALLGQASVEMPGGGNASGSREFCKSLLASRWLLASKSEQEFVRRMKSLPADVAGERHLDWNIRESDAKRWVMGLGPEYASTRRKLQAIQYIIEQGVASEGIRRYGEELLKAAAQP